MHAGCTIFCFTLRSDRSFSFCAVLHKMCSFFNFDRPNFNIHIVLLCVSDVTSNEKVADNSGYSIHFLSLIGYKVYI